LATESGNRAGTRVERFRPGDAMRVAAAAGVVVDHVAAWGFERYGEIATRDWWVFNLAVGATRWAVPLFVMLSGALLLDPRRTEGPREFYARRLRRIAIPFVFWCLFYIAFRFALRPSAFSLGGMVSWLALGQPFYHMHYLFIIVGLYLFTPAFRAVVAQSGRGLLILATALMLGLASADLVLASFGVGGGGEPNAASRFVPFIGYYFLGACLREWVATRRGVALAWVGAVAAAAAVTLGGGLVMNTRWEARLMFLYEPLSPPNILMTSCVFVLFQASCRGVDGRLVSRWLAPATLGIYLVHPAVIYLVRKVGLTGMWPTPWVGIPLAAGAVFLGSFAATALIQQVPWVRRIVG